jgi:hypothetical protein
MAVGLVPVRLAQATWRVPPGATAIDGKALASCRKLDPGAGFTKSSVTGATGDVPPEGTSFPRSVEIARRYTACLFTVSRQAT